MKLDSPEKHTADAVVKVNSPFLGNSAHQHSGAPNPKHFTLTWKIETFTVSQHLLVMHCLQAMVDFKGPDPRWEEVVAKDTLQICAE